MSEMLPTTLAQIEEFAANQQAEIQNLKTALEAQQNAHNRLLELMAPSYCKPPSLAAPPYFSGDRKKAKGFLMQIENFFRVDHSRFQTESQKVSFIISFFRDTALDWITPYVETHSPILDNYQIFISAFKNSFLNLDSKNAESEIFKLKQGKAPVSLLVSNFQRLAFEADISGKALFPLFYRALNEDIKDEISKLARPDTIEKYYELATQIDNRIFERKQERRSSSVSVPRPTKPDPKEEPMILDSTRYTKLSAEERKRRRDQNLCRYCGSDEHLITACPLRPGKGGARA